MYISLFLKKYLNYVIEDYIYSVTHRMELLNICNTHLK